MTLCREKKSSLKLSSVQAREMHNGGSSAGYRLMVANILQIFETQ